MNSHNNVNEWRILNEKKQNVKEKHKDKTTEKIL